MAGGTPPPPLLIPHLCHMNTGPPMPVWLDTTPMGGSCLVALAQVRASRFAPLVIALGNSVITRWVRAGDAPHRDGGGTLWRSAAHALMAAVNAGEVSV